MVLHQIIEIVFGKAWEIPVFLGGFFFFYLKRIMKTNPQTLCEIWNRDTGGEFFCFAKQESPSRKFISRKNRSFFDLEIDPVMRVPGPPLRDCTERPNILGPRRPKMSAIDVTAKTMHARLVLVRGGAQMCLFVLNAHTPTISHCC